VSDQYALSIKQPWAALLIHGVKTIEVRRWPTRRRGRILIHAARVPDSRAQGWKLVTPEIHELTRLRGGILGAAELVECVVYHHQTAFQADQELHRNDPDWFQSPCLYGFRFANVEQLPFRKIAGNVRFFSVPSIAVSDA
jgi:hypothetical protein